MKRFIEFSAFDLFTVNIRYSRQPCFINALLQQASALDYGIYKIFR